MQRQNCLNVGLAAPDVVVHHPHLDVGLVFRWVLLFSLAVTTIAATHLQQVSERGRDRELGHGTLLFPHSGFPCIAHHKRLDGFQYTCGKYVLPARRPHLACKASCKGGGCNLSLSPYRVYFSSIPSTSALCLPKCPPSPPPPACCDFVCQINRGTCCDWTGRRKVNFNLCD